MSAPRQQGSAASSQAEAPAQARADAVTADLTRSPEGRTARLTLISVLLGAMVAAIVVALPPSPAAFTTSVFASGHLLLDLQVLAILAQVFYYWLDQSWTVLLGRAIFSFFTNVYVFLMAVIVIGWALSVSDFRAWSAWGAASAGVTFLGEASLAVIYRLKPPWSTLALSGGATLAAVYVVFDLYGLLPTWATISISPELWTSLVLAEIVASLANLGWDLRGSAKRSARK